MATRKLFDPDLVKFMTTTLAKGAKLDESKIDAVDAAYLFAEKANTADAWATAIDCAMALVFEAEKYESEARLGVKVCNKGVAIWTKIAKIHAKGAKRWAKIAKDWAKAVESATTAKSKKKKEKD